MANNKVYLLFVFVAWIYCRTRVLWKIANILQICLPINFGAEPKINIKGLEFVVKKICMLWAGGLMMVFGAKVVVPQESSDISITIYNDNRAFVIDRREANVSKGRQKLVYEGVAGSMITPSVIPVFGGVKTRLYSQNYIYDLVSLESMLKNSVDKNVEFYTNGDNPTLSKGTLIAYKPAVMVRQKGTGRILTLDKPTQVVFPSVPKSMITRPSLVWNIETADKGKLDIDLEYLTNDVSWKSDYVLNLDQKSFDLAGWITVNNQSGVSYPDAQITCLAGDVGRVENDLSPKIYRKTKALATMASPQIKEEAFSGYHIYKIPFRETIANKQQKQIRFIDKSGAAYIHYGKMVNSYFEKYNTQKLRFKNIIEFDNTRSNHLGIPLPGGIVRMYRKDSAGDIHFIGESRISNTPQDEKVKLTVGTLFDATGEKKISKFVVRKGYRNVETTYTLHNRGKESLELRIDERIPVYGDSIKTKTSCQGICTVSKKNAFFRTFTIKLKPKESYEFTSEFEVYY